MHYLRKEAPYIKIIFFFYLCGIGFGAQKWLWQKSGLKKGMHVGGIYVCIDRERESNIKWKKARSIDIEIDRGIDRGNDRWIDRGIYRGIDRGIYIGIDKGIDRGIDRRIDRGIDREIYRGIDRGIYI